MMQLNISVMSEDFPTVLVTNACSSTAWLSRHLGPPGRHLLARIDTDPLEIDVLPMCKWACRYLTQDIHRRGYLCGCRSTSTVERSSKCDQGHSDNRPGHRGLRMLGWPEIGEPCSNESNGWTYTRHHPTGGTSIKPQDVKSVQICRFVWSVALLAVSITYLFNHGQDGRPRVFPICRRERKHEAIQRDAAVARPGRPGFVSAGGGAMQVRFGSGQADWLGKRQRGTCRSCVRDVTPSDWPSPETI